MDFVAICREFGFPILSCVALFLAIIWVAKQLLGAFKSRIETLEKIVAAIERQYKIKIEDAELQEVSTLNKSFDLVKGKLDAGTAKVA